MSRIGLVAAAELRLMARSRLAVIGLLALLALAAVAALTSARQTGLTSEIRHAQQHAAEAAFDAQPDRHPHRMAHFGSYAIRPMSPLAAFDSGVDPFTGVVLYLEAHRQNSATFGAARESSDLVRFGQLTPAFVLESLAPLLLIFLGFAMVARERETGGLRLLRAHGATGFDIVGGKALALAVAAGAAVLPAWLALGVAAARDVREAGVSAVIGLGYTAYLLAWVCAIAAVSALARSSRAALIGLFALWAVCVVIVPRLSAAWATSSIALPSKAETDLVIQAELRQLGDSHNPDDPYFNAFRARVLASYGVAKVEDLPLNYRGLLSAEGEKLTSKLFADHAARAAAIQAAQSRQQALASWVSPSVALRRLSMIGAGTDLSAHLSFLDQGEAHRFQLVQALNRIHATQVNAQADALRSKDQEAQKRSRVSSDNWRTIPDFSFVATTPAQRLAAMLGWLAQLGLWLAFAAILLWGGARRLNRETA
jgi:ABC-2 type transport system permease protein